LDHSINDLLQKRVGGAQPNVSQQIIKNIDIPLPPISEQQKIVEILDQADRLRKLRTDADKKAERILSALFIKIFGDPATNPMGWRTGTLGDVVIETQYGTSARANTDGKGLPVIRMNNIDKAGYLDVSDIKYIVFSENEKKKYLLNKGDILFNRTNSKELVGKTGIWSGQMDAVFASYLIRIRIDSGKIVPEFLWALMNLPFTKQMLLNKSRRAIGMANINAKELRNFPVYIPLKTLQEDFAEKMFKVIANKDERQKRGKKMEILFTHLLHCAFTGDLTTSWRQAHMEELLQEMEIQARVLAK
jgi:type I restriction enzyme S subunit